MLIRIILISSICGLWLVTAGCGGGGSSPASKGQRKMTSAVSLPTSPTQTVGGLQLTLHFPVGVTVNIDADGKPIVAEVAQLVGAGDHANAQCFLNYVPATAAAGEGVLKLSVIDPSGFIAGESVSIQLNIGSGFTPEVSAFTISDLIVSDLDGNTVENLTPVFTVEKF
jgi:hypothetical protein